MYRFRLFGFETLANMKLTIPMAEASPLATPELFFRCLPAGLGEVQASAGISLYLSKRLNDAGEPAVQLFEVSGSAWLMRFPGIADFYLRTGEIECRLVEPGLAYMINILLLGHVMACYLEHQGILALHAGAIMVGERAVLLAGDKGAGKSTLVSSMVAAGFPLMADDIAAVEERAGRVCCRSAFPLVKLTPEQLTLFGKGRFSAYPRFHPGFTKLSVPVTDLGSFDAEARPVGAIYLIDRANYASPVIETLPPTRAVAELARHSFLGHILEATPMLRDRFTHLVRVARTTPVKMLRYPDGCCYLAEVHAAIERDLEVS
ncbi:hypothetical protein [Halomonas saccharevitans]|uniref:Hpr(Ser) kinase/phosphatase n=1 Tax=Halomonas saccharevitans TaxID=416872 RepID=A0A1I7BDW0_9GAMM|nr:hypothetical protein [Halomonas saccharevitans]SFT85389.1 hypothetical protein SAMN04487956_12542 [Halomonas saccharevitans]